MSTEINIKKRITILEESAILTKDVNSIDFIGAGVIASTIGEDVTVTIPGGSGNTTYYLNESVTQTPYKEFSSIVTSAIEQVVPLTVAGGVTSVIAEYQTPSGVPGTTQIPGGLWQFFLHFNAGAAGQNWIIRPTVYKRDLGGIETLLFTPDPEIVTGMSTTTTMYVSDGVFPATTLLTTDRIVVRISMQNTTGVSQTVNFRTEGSQHYSVGLTTLNQVIPTGAVTSVTGTAPVVSSGGTTPAISIPQATGAVDGYLSSSDFAVFNAKVGGSGTLNYVSKFTGTGTIGNSNIFDDGTNVGIGITTPTASLHVTNVGTQDSFLVEDSTNPDATPFVITNTGRVGIGTTAPGYELDIRSSNPQLRVYADINNRAFSIYPGQGTIESDNTAFYINRISTDDIALGIGGGNVGIGIATPTEKLEVNGKTKTTTFQMTTTPTAGYVLTSDASGNGTWQVGGSASGIFGIANSSGVYTFYATLTLAMAGAVSGDTILQFANVVETGNVTITLKNGVNINGNGYTYTYSNIAGHCFIDNASTVICNIIDFYTIRTSASGSSSVWNITGASSEVYFYGGLTKDTVNTAHTTAIFNCKVMEGYNGLVTGVSAGVTGCSVSIGIFRNVKSIVSSGGGNGFYVTATCVSATNIYGYSTDSFTCGVLISGAGTYTNITGESTAGVGVATNVSSAKIYNSVGRSTTDRGISSSNGGLWVSCIGISSSYHGIFGYGGTFKNCNGYSATGNGVYLQDGNDVNDVSFNGGTVTSDGAIAMVRSASGSYRNTIKSVSITCKWNNAGGHALQKIGGGNVWLSNCSLAVTNASANCIHATSAVTMTWGLNSFEGSTTAVNANVTQLLVNTADAQGNLLL